MAFSSQRSLTNPALSISFSCRGAGLSEEAAVKILRGADRLRRRPITRDLQRNDDIVRFEAYVRLLEDD